MLAARHAADKLAIANSPHPVPTVRLDQRKPGAAKSGICQDDGGRGLFRQDTGQTLQKALVYGIGTQMATRMYFLIERDRARLDDDRGAQPVPAQVCREA